MSAVDIDLRLLRYLTVVVQERSFTRAAEQLAMTQPALSRAIRSMENAVGVDLLVRGPGGVEPTAAGTVLLDSTRDIPARIRIAVERARAAGLGQERLRLVARGCDVEVAARLTATYRPGRPERGTRIEIDASGAGSAPESLRQGICDIALIRDLFDATDLDREPLWSEPRVALLSSAHPLSHRPEIGLAELHGDPVTVWPSMTAAEQAYWAGADQDGHPWRPGPQVASATDVLAAVRLDQAVAFVPASQAPADSAIPGLRVRPVPELSGSTLYVVWLAAATSLQIAQFVRHAVEEGRKHIHAA